MRMQEARVASGGTSAFTPHVVVLLPSLPSRAQLLRRLAEAARVTILEQERPLPKLAPADIAVLHADSLNVSCSPLMHDPDLGFPELVFVVDAAWSPQHFALESRGFRHVVSQQDLSEWLPIVLMQLGSLAQARRIVLGACAGRPTLGELPATSRQTRGIKLHAAETSFRAAFMRSLLAEHGCRRRAAEAAGVPYRSFCEMVRKLGI
jgi:hypothetical protein